MGKKKTLYKGTLRNTELAYLSARATGFPGMGETYQYRYAYSPRQAKLLLHRQYPGMDVVLIEEVKKRPE